MTLAEFKAWFGGFTEDMEGAPTAKQWKRIKDRVKQIDGVAVTKEVFYRDRYWPTFINNTSTPHISWSSPFVHTGIEPTSAIGSANSLIDLAKAEYQSLAS